MIFYKGQMYVRADNTVKELIHILSEGIAVFNTKRIGGKVYAIDKHDIDERARNIAQVLLSTFEIKELP